MSDLGRPATADQKGQRIMDPADVNALIEGCLWPENSPALRYTGGRGSAAERETAALDALEQATSRPYTTDDRARRVLNRHGIGRPIMTEAATLTCIDIDLRRLAFARHSSDPTRSVAAHLVALANEVSAVCDLWAARPDKLERYSPKVLVTDQDG